MSVENTKVTITSKTDYQYVLVDKILQIATENKVVIYGSYVHEVLAYYKARLPALNLNADINFWAKNSVDWRNFSMRLGKLCDVIFRGNSCESGKYQISIMGNIVCEGKVLIGDFHNIDIDIDLLVCDDFNEAGISLISVDNSYNAAKLINQIISKEFHVITNSPGPSLYKRQNKLYANKWNNLTVKYPAKKETSSEPNKISELLGINRVITTKLDNISGARGSADGYAYHESITKSLVSQVLQLSKLMENVLETLKQ